MEIWAHTMVKNEARWLWFSVTSVIDFVDKILLWDTGSTDGTMEIARTLSNKYPDKILLNQTKINTPEEFTVVRQQMLDASKSDWILMLDGDEIWWRASIKTVTDTIRNKGLLKESLVVPTINCVGDIFHFQDESGGRYNFGGKVGHYNLRGINRKIPGLKSLGKHGVWGWADEEGQMIQDRDPKLISILEAPYLHTTFLNRGLTSVSDKSVIKRAKKYKYEIGRKMPLDFYYPESFFEDRPDFIESPWNTMNAPKKIRSLIETPLRKFKRKIWLGKAGY